MKHARTHHTTPSRNRGARATAPLGGRWRNPELAQAALADFVV